MSIKAERGTKRTCRNPECGARFYDLNRDPVLCPICQTVFEPTPAPALVGAAAAEESVAAVRGSGRKPPYTVESAKPEAAVAEGEEDALPPIEDDEEAAAAEEDETFLEAEEEDGSDMSNIIGGPVAEPDEPQ
jgi:uncharacterized protein (TIGR02300 family)